MTFLIDMVATTIVVRLHHRRGNKEGVGVQKSSSQPDGDQMHIVVDPVHELVAARLVGDVHRRDEGLVLGEDLAPAELIDGLLGRIAAAFGDHHGTLEAGSQVVEDSVHGIGVRGNQLPAWVETIGFDENVLLGLESWPDLVVDRDQRLENVLAPVFTLDQGHFGAAIGILEQLGDIGGGHAGVLRRGPAIDGWLIRHLLRVQCQTLGCSNRPRA
jgi:hypothetical protein